MCKYAIRITSVDVGPMILTFAEQGSARAVVEHVSSSTDPRISAEYLGATSRLHVTHALDLQMPAESARRQLMAAYDRALPHREALDVTDLKVETEGRTQVASGYVLGMIRGQ